MAPLTIPFDLQLHYDEEADVLYASLDKPGMALCYEVDTDILLRYVPPDDRPVGVTIISFLERFPRPEAAPFLDHARHVVSELLTQYPQVPANDR